MNNSSVSVSSSWSHVGGCVFAQSIQERVSDPGLFIRPHLNELVNEEKSILLSKAQSSEFCELYVKLVIQYKIQAVSFVCNVVKVEIFHGPIKEYFDTIYGVAVDEQHDQFKCYRYDFEVEKSGISDLTLRFLTDSSDVCIFGIILHTFHNSKVITLPTEIGCLNIQNVDNISKNLIRQPNSVPDKFSKLLELATKRNQPNSLTLDQQIKSKMYSVSEEYSANVSKTTEDMFNDLRSHIDIRFQEMELRLNRYFGDMEQRQNQKIDMMLNILEKLNK